MKKSYYIAGAILLVAIIATSAALIKNQLDIRASNGSTTQDPMINVDTAEYQAYVKLESDIEAPLQQSDIENVYFTINTSGEVKFYEYKNSSLSPLEATGSFSVKVNMSEQKIPAKIYYLTKDGKTSGYGLFTPQLTTDTIKIYDYAFFHLMNTPAQFSKKGAYMLAVDTTVEDFYINNKIYEEPYYCNITNGETSRILSEENRQPDKMGAKRADYSLFTTDVMNDCKGELLFFSSRFYETDGANKKLDLFESGNKGHNNVDNYRMIEDISDFYAKNVDDGFICLKNTATGFDAVLHKDRKAGSKEEVIKSFTGDFKNNYLRYGDYIIEKATLSVFNMVTKESYKINAGSVSDFKPDQICIDESSGAVFMRGYSLNHAAILLGNLKTGSGKVLYNEKFLNLINPVSNNDGSFTLTASKDSKGSAYYYIILAEK